MAATSPQGAAGSPSTIPVGGLPLSYSPICATYAPGPFLDVEVVTPSEIRWMNARTYVVRDRQTSQDYKALRILNPAHEVVGYWAIELLPTPLDFGVDFDADHADAVTQCEEERQQIDRDRKRRRLGRPDDLG